MHITDAEYRFLVFLYYAGIILAVLLVMGAGVGLFFLGRWIYKRFKKNKEVLRGKAKRRKEGGG